MESFELTSLQVQLQRRKRVVKEIDDKLAQELTRKAVLEELYGDSSIQQSENSRSALNESSISQGQSSLASIDSTFLKRQIQNVYSFMHQRNGGKEVNQTNTRTHLINTQNKAKYEHNQRKQEQKEDDQSSFFNKTTKDHNEIVKLINKEQLKIRWQQQQAQKNKELIQFLEAKQQTRQQSLKQERLKIRQQLLKEQKLTKQNIKARTDYKLKTFDMNIKVSDNDTLKMQRSLALNRLLKEVQSGRRQTHKLIQRTRIASYK